MSHRTQITLEDEQYERLLGESAATGLSLAELVRRAVDREYGAGSTQERQAALEVSFGSVRVELDGAAYVDSLRRGLGHRLDPS
jgi:hypothetical protein